MRCLALAQAWQDAGGRASFAVAEIPVGLRQRVTSLGFDTISLPAPPGSVQDADLYIAFSRQMQADWLVIDGDRFNSRFLSRLQGSSARTLLIDDFAERESWQVDVILNFNFGINDETYRSVGFDGRLLLGESYALLRREFTSNFGKRTYPELGNRVLVTMGGSDPENLAPRVVASLSESPDLKVSVIAGAGYSQFAHLEALKGSNVEVKFNVFDMSVAMSEADMAIIAAGGTLWELLCMGCVVLSYARNSLQASVVAALAKMNVVEDMGSTRDFSETILSDKVRELSKSSFLRESMAKAGRRLIDGRGARRVVDALMPSGG